MRRELPAQLAEILTLLQEVEDRGEVLEHLVTIVTYVVRGAEKITPDELGQAIKEVVRKEEAEELMPTIAEQWIEQGRQEGHQEGHQEGFEEGRHQTLVEMLQQILTFHFGVHKGRFASRLAALDLATLKQLSEVALTASTLAEFEAALDDTLPYQPGEKGPSAG